MISQSLIGLWLFTGLLYQGNTLPLPNPDLKIYYRFEDTGLNTLYYHRLGESGFCERRAVYDFAAGKLSQQVVWVNPQNAPWCNEDMDMRLGYQSWSEAWIEGGQFHLIVQMGEEQLVYIWDKMENTFPAKKMPENR